MHLYTAAAPTHLITLLALKAPSDLDLLSYTGLEKKQAHFQGHIHKNNTRTHLTPSQTDAQLAKGCLRDLISFILCMYMCACMCACACLSV